MVPPAGARWRVGVGLVRWRRPHGLQIANFDIQAYHAYHACAQTNVRPCVTIISPSRLAHTLQLSIGARQPPDRAAVPPAPAISLRQANRIPTTFQDM